MAKKKMPLSCLVDIFCFIICGYNEEADGLPLEKVCSGVGEKLGREWEIDNENRGSGIK
jgi:hypothetical protein